jgi:hypothetical protein
LISKSKQIANTANIIQVLITRGKCKKWCKKTCLNYISNKGQTKFGIIFFEKSSRFFAIRPRFYTPSPRIFYLKKQFSAETMLFSWENFYFSQKIHYKHGNLKYLNNFSYLFRIAKSKIWFIIPLFKIYVTKLLRNHHRSVACLFALFLWIE